jgi:elongator complex protein 3
VREDYDASGGREIFLSFETDSDKLVGFARLRIPDEPFRKEIGRETAGIRELHVYGPAAKIGEKSEFSQHQGFGKRLVAEAEKIASEEFDMKDMLVISGVGVRDYYRKLGYERRGAYMGKALK